MNDPLTIGAAVLIAAAVILLLLPPKWDPAIRIKERQIEAGTHPESIDRDVLAINKGHCPDCRKSETLLAGPSGGMSQNVLCNNCLSEFNVHFGFGTGAFKVDRSGKASEGRAAVFGIDRDEFRQIERELYSGER